MRLRATLLCVVLSAFSSLMAIAQTVDAAAVLNARLAAAGAVRKATYREVVQQVCQDQCCGGLKECADCTKCKDVKIHVPAEYRAPLVVAGPITSSVTTKTGPIVVNSIPEKVYITSFEEKNCGGVPVSRAVSLSLSAQNSYSANVTQSVAIGTTINGSVTVQAAGVGSASINVGFSKNVTLSESKTESESDSVTVADSASITVPGLTEVVHRLMVWESSVSVPFTATIVVDAPVDANLDGYSLVSQVLSENARTFQATGVLSVTKASDGKGGTTSRVLSAAECAGMEGKAVNRILNGSPTPLGLRGGRLVTPNVQRIPGDDGSALIMSETTLDAFSRQQGERLAARFKANSERGVTERSLGERLLESGKLADRWQSYTGNTPSFLAAGQHQCQSSTDIGHTCEVSGLGYNDCNEATFMLRADDCCPRTIQCGVDSDGKPVCHYGGTSIGFVMNYCVPL